jgi:hypothetical protein
MGSQTPLQHKVIDEAAHTKIKSLHHVDAPKDGLSEGVKQAFLADHQAGVAPQ